MFAKLTTRAAPAALALALAACDGGGGGGPTEPVAGVLTLSIDAPDTDDRAMVVQITGPGAIGEVTAARATHRLFARPLPGGGVRAAVFGTLSDGPLLRFEVPDVSKATAYAATVSEVSDAQNGVRAGTLGYVLHIDRE